MAATLERQAISGLGDDSVVYEGSLDLTGADGKRSQVAMGSVLVRVGRATEAIVYFAQGSDPTDVLAPAIDASVGAPACRPDEGHLVIRRALLVAVVAGGIVSRRGGAGDCRRGLLRPGDRPCGRPREVGLPLGLEEQHARPDLRRRARRRGHAGRVVPAVPGLQQGQQEEPACQVAEFRARAIERHQRGERVPVDREGGRRDTRVLRPRAFPTASNGCSARSSSGSSRRAPTPTRSRR